MTDGKDTSKAVDDVPMKIPVDDAPAAADEDKNVASQDMKEEETKPTTNDNQETDDDIKKGDPVQSESNPKQLQSGGETKKTDSTTDEPQSGEAGQTKSNDDENKDKTQVHTNNTTTAAAAAAAEEEENASRDTKSKEQEKDKTTAAPSDTASTVKDTPMMQSDDNITDTTVMALKNQSEEAIIQGALELGDVKVPDLNAPGSVSAAGKNGKAFFPMKLYDIVSDEKNEDIIKWLPGGKAFIIVDKKRFANEVLPLHFQQSQFTSFTRKLSRWRFTRVPRGPFIGAYYNKLFLKGHRSLCWHMRCKNENIGKIKFDRKMSDSLNHNGSVPMDPTTQSRVGMLPQQPHPHTMMSVPNQMTMQGFHMPPMGSGPTGYPMPGHPPNLQGGVNPGLNNQILAIEGRLRELQNVRSAEQAAFMYDPQKMMQQHTMDDYRARMIGMTNGMNNMVDYGNPHLMGAPGAPPAPGVSMPPGAPPMPPPQPPQMQPQHHSPPGAPPGPPTQQQPPVPPQQGDVLPSTAPQSMTQTPAAPPF